MRLVGLRAAALAAALVLAVLSRGDAIVLAILLAVGAWRPLPAVAVVGALSAAAWRWSSNALEDIAGAQAVLGPAGAVDPPTAATAAWLGALALVLATPNLVEAWLFERAHAGALSTVQPRWLTLGLEWLPPLAAGVGAAVVVAGPAPGGDLWERFVAAVVATALARLVTGRRRVLDRHLVLDASAAVLGLGSLAMVAVDAPPLDGLLDTDALVEGVVVALAVGLLAAAAGTLVASRQHGAAGRDGRAPEGHR